MPALPRMPEAARIARADAFFAALNIPIIIGSDQACYRPDIETVLGSGGMPAFVTEAAVVAGSVDEAR